jgi:hypothetical protein
MNKDKFEKLAVLEMKAMYTYKQFLAGIKDNALLEKIKGIAEDEEKHYDLAKKFLDLIRE